MAATVYNEEYDDFEQGEDTIIFYEDGTADWYEYDNYFQLEWKITGGKVYTKMAGGSWNIIPITKITSTQITIEYSETETEDGVKYYYYQKSIYQKRQ